MSNATNAQSGSTADLISTVVPNKASSIKKPKDTSSIEHPENTNSNISTINKKAGTTNAYVTQTTKQSVVPMSADSDQNTEKEKISKLSKEEKDSLSKATGEEIRTDGDLNKALSKVGQNLKGILGGGRVDMDNPVFSFKAGISESTSSDESDIKDISDKIKNNHPGLPSLADEVKSNGVVSDMPSITDSEYNAVDGIPETAGYPQVKAMQDLMSKLCPDATTQDLFDFELSINLFQSLLSLAAKLGLFGLLQQLIECIHFYDRLVDNPLKALLPLVASKGDAGTFSVISQAIGPTAPNSVGNTNELIKNLHTDEQSTITKLNTSIGSLGITNSDITEKNIPDSEMKVKSLSKRDNLQSPSNRGVIDNLFGNDDSSNMSLLKNFM